MNRVEIALIMGIFAVLSLVTLVREIDQGAELRTKDACYRLAYVKASGQEARTEFYNKCLRSPNN